MSIETIRRKNSVHHRAVVRISRKRVSKTFDRKADARAWEARMLSRAEHRETSALISPHKEACTLSKVMLRFEVEHCSIRNAPSTRIMNRSLYDNYLGQPFGTTPVDALDPQAFESYILGLIAHGKISNGRANRIRQLLHAILNKAVRWRLVPSNPIALLSKLPDRDYYDPETVRFLSKTEADRLLEWLRANDSWLYPKVVVLLYTGIRYGEMSALRTRDVRLISNNPQLSICRARCRHTGQFLPPKGKRTRVIPLSNGLAAFIDSLFRGKQPDEPLLWGSWEEGRWPSKCDGRFRKAIECAKVSRITIHHLRHTFAVRFLENGGNLFDLKELLGHSNLKTTLRYSHFSPTMAERARGVVDFERPAPQLTVVDGGVR